MWICFEDEAEQKPALAEDPGLALRLGYTLVVTVSAKGLGRGVAVGLVCLKPRADPSQHRESRCACQPPHHPHIFCIGSAHAWPGS